MSEKLEEQLEGLLTKYTELLLGESDQDLINKVRTWILYTYISKTMPPLVKHWNEMYPDGKEEMKELITEIKRLNDVHRQTQEK